MKKYFAPFTVISNDSYKKGLAWGITYFLAKNPGHASRKIKAEAQNLKEKLPPEYKDYAISVLGNVYRSPQEVPESGLPGLGLIEL
jgi:hypothetical protein